MRQKNRLHTFLAMTLLMPVILLSACEQDKDAAITIIERKTFESISSGSGIAVKGDTAYIVGDDATCIYQLNFKTNELLKILINGRDSSVHREPKDVKLDLESACLIKWEQQDHLMAFGSGSLQGKRDSLLLLNLSNPNDCKNYSVQGFYENVRRQLGISLSQWNIEGCSVIDGNLILANRGDNRIIIVNLNDFLRCLEEASSNYPVAESHILNLPSIDGKQARLSGLCTINPHELLFCASVEDTPDWVQDGPILGSFIGQYSLSRKEVTAYYILNDSNGKPILEKLESVDMIESSNNERFVIAVSDNDNGSSTIFKLRLP